MYHQFTYNNKPILIKVGTVKIARPYGQQTILSVSGMQKELIVDHTINEVAAIIGVGPILINK